MARRTYSDEEVEAAVAAISDPARLEEAQRLVVQRAPQLQQILYQALHDSDWFGAAHQQAIRQALAEPNPEAAVHRLIAEETRITLLIGVAAGLELEHELEHPSGGPEKT